MGIFFLSFHHVYKFYLFADDTNMLFSHKNLKSLEKINKQSVFNLVRYVNGYCLIVSEEKLSNIKKLAIQAVRHSVCILQPTEVNI